MPRVHHVKKARKDNPVANKGEPYYWWKNYRSPKRYSITRPKRSQLTGSDKLSRLYEANENVGEIDSWETGDAIDTLAEAAEEVRAVGEEYMESADAIRDTFSESETADECEEKSYACESTGDSLDEAVNLIEDYRDNHKVSVSPGEVSEVETGMSDYITEVIQGIEWEGID